MLEVEVGFKIKEDLKTAEKILLENGFENSFKNAITRDIYFGKNVNLSGKDETEIKRSLIRLRGFETFENLKLLDKKLPNKLKVDFNTLLSYLERIIKEGFEVVFDTQKSDWIYKKGNFCHQLQNINHIGLLDYVYVRIEDHPDASEDEQFEFVKKHILDLGFHLEYELGVDKLRSLYSHNLEFSKSQIGKYEWQ